MVGVLSDIPYQPGARETILALKDRDIKTVILSTGLSFLVERVRQDLDISLSLSNDLLSENGCLTGKIRINVDYNRKNEVVEAVLSRIGIDKKEACAIGDGEGDAGMFEAVGLSVVFHLNQSVFRAPH